MNFVIQILLSAFTKFLIKLLTSFASEKMFAHTMFSLMKAGAKSTKTEWDDEWVAKMEEAFKNLDK